MRLPSSAASTSNWSQARPGTFISACRRRRRSGSKASTRQKSSGSPGRMSTGCRRPRRMPTPPTSKSAAPRSPHNQFAKYHPREPPMRWIGAKARAVSAGTSACCRSTIREPKRLPPQSGPRPLEDTASLQRVRAISRSSSRSARAIASPTPRGRTGKRSRTASSRTTVSLRRLVMSFRPTRAYTGVTRPSHRLESRGLRRGTGIMTRRTPIWRAYSCINSP